MGAFNLSSRRMLGNLVCDMSNAGAACGADGEMGIATAFHAHRIAAPVR